MTSRALLTAGWGRAGAAFIVATMVLAGCNATTVSPATSPAASTSTSTSTATAAAVASAPPSTGAPSTAASSALLRGAPGGACLEGGTGTACIAPGTYALDASIAPAMITIDVPRGWFEWDPGGGTEGLLVDGGNDAPSGSGWGLLFSPLGKIFPDPCRQASAAARSVATVDEAVAGMTAWPGFTVGKPKAITVDGRPGKAVEVTSTLRPSACPLPALWTTPSGMPVDAYPVVNNVGVRPTQYWVVDVDGKLLIIRVMDDGQPSPFEVSQGVKSDPKRHAEDQIALRAILQSIRLKPAG